MSGFLGYEVTSKMGNEQRYAVPSRKVCCIKPLLNGSKSDRWGAEMSASVVKMGAIANLFRANDDICAQILCKKCENNEI
jgi:hypothetical protein